MAYTYKDDLDKIEDKKKDSKKLTLNALTAASDMGLDPTYGGDGTGPEPSPSEGIEWDFLARLDSPLEATLLEGDYDTLNNKVNSLISEESTEILRVGCLAPLPPGDPIMEYTVLCIIDNVPPVENALGFGIMIEANVYYLYLHSDNTLTIIPANPQPMS